MTTWKFVAANFYRNLERIAFGRNFEQADLNAVGGHDAIGVFSSLSDQTHIRAGGGNDTINVNSTTHAAGLTIGAGTGNDQIFVKKTHAVTTLDVFGDAGDDTLSVGASLEEDNGNLGQLRGALTFDGGPGNDQLFVSDGGASGAYGYRITPTQIVNHPGRFNLARDVFAGIFYDGGVEHVRLNGTQQANNFVITSSQDTEFYLDGNNPTNDETIADEIELTSNPGDGRGLNITDADLGDGFWTFENGDQDVFFEEFESILDQ